MNEYQYSVIIPTRNRRDDLHKCLDSLSQQDFDRAKYEVIVCDDGSDEPVDSLIDDFSQIRMTLRCVRQEPKGPAAARNLGIRNARGSIVAMTDSDTLPDKLWLKKIDEAFQANPDAVGVEGRVYAENEGEFDPLGEGPVNKEGGVFLTCNCAYRRDALIAAGGFDESFPFPAYEDTELAARIQQFGRIVWQPEAVVLHPQRPLTLRAVWKKLHHWEYIQIMGHRYGYLAWRHYPVRHPGLRVALLSVIALPLAKFKIASRWLFRKPLAALKLAGFGIVESIGALFVVVPKALFGGLNARAERPDYLRISK